MSYDEGLAERLYEVFEGRVGYSDKRMFGGLGFMVQGHMVVGIVKDELMVRVGKEGWAEALTLPGARPMDFTGRPMKTMVFVDQGALQSDEELEAWVQRALDFVLSLPPK
jgi:TfoX/Sxy family transcriptional regulator of competence genes